MHDAYGHDQQFEQDEMKAYLARPQASNIPTGIAKWRATWTKLALLFTGTNFRHNKESEIYFLSFMFVRTFPETPQQQKSSIMIVLLRPVLAHDLRSNKVPWPWISHVQLPSKLILYFIFLATTDVCVHLCVRTWDCMWVCACRYIREQFRQHSKTLLQGVNLAGIATIFDHSFGK